MSIFLDTKSPYLHQSSLPKDNIQVVLLEGVHHNAIDHLARLGYTSVTCHTKALEGDDLSQSIQHAHIVGIRSRTKLTQSVLQCAPKLFAIGCFCIGTNQVDVEAARIMGIPVFNAPYSNTRSVAELVLGSIIMLARRVPEKNWNAHRGVWLKTTEGACEVRGKTLGIIGYGHIGTQLSILAEALGMRVIFYDCLEKLALGNAHRYLNLATLLAESDFVSLHVPDTPQTRDMMTATELAQMKPGAALLNASRGRVVDVGALAEALTSGHLSGAAIDVFPDEPADEKNPFTSPLRGLRNVLLTPHIGGSTLEAQANIGTEVAEKLTTYSDNGSTMGAVNFPEAQLLHQRHNSLRFIHIHRNAPGVMTQINEIISAQGANIIGQHLQTRSDIGYVVFDLENLDTEDTLPTQQMLHSIPGTIRARFLS